MIDPVYSMNKLQRKKKGGPIKHKNKIKINKRDLRDISTNEKG